MACDCDQLNNRIRNLEDRLRRLERGGSAGSGGNNQNDDLVERVFKDPRWIAATDIFQFIIKGRA